MKRPWSSFMVVAGLVVAMACQSDGQQKGDAAAEPSGESAPPSDLADRVEQAFRAARNDDFAACSDLVQYGKAVIPLLEPYLEDADVDVRRQVVGLLQAAEDPSAVPLLVRALRDRNDGIQERAAYALFHTYDPKQIAGHEAAAHALRGSVAAGNDTAPALLLLGYFPGPESVEVLRKVRKENGTEIAKLHMWSPTVPVSVAVDVSLCRLRDKRAHGALLKRIGDGDLNTLSFLLAVAREINSSKALEALASATLDDTRPIGSGAPSGAPSSRRLCDDAVNAFVKRLSLKVDFPLNDALAYTPEQIDQVRRKVRGAIRK